MPYEKRDIVASPGQLDIIYEDCEILILNKPPYCITHPTRKDQRDTLANFISHYWLENQVDAKIRFIMRLDRDTTGLIAIAKNKYIHHFVQKQMEEQIVKKKYIAYVHGKFNKRSGTINKAIGLKDGESIQRSVLKSGQEARTHYRVLEEFTGASLVELVLETGRTHQIRVHLAHIGHPILGDSLYFSEESYLFSQALEVDHQALHASELKLTLPLKGELFVKAKVQKNMIELEDQLMKLSGKRGKE